MQRQTGVLHIVREGWGAQSNYELRYVTLSDVGGTLKALSIRGAQTLIELLEDMGIDFRNAPARAALEDLLLHGCGDIPDVWLSPDELARRGMIEKTAQAYKPAV